MSGTRRRPDSTEVDALAQGVVDLASLTLELAGLDAAEGEAVVRRVIELLPRAVAPATATTPASDSAPSDDLRARVLAFVVEHAPAPKRAVRSGVRGRATDIDRALEALERQGLLERGRDGWRPCPVRDTADTAEVIGGERHVGDAAAGQDPAPSAVPPEPSLVGGACPDPNRCEYRLRHAAGPWSRSANHPRTARDVEGDDGRAALRVVGR